MRAPCCKEEAEIEQGKELALVFLHEASRMPGPFMPILSFDPQLLGLSLDMAVSSSHLGVLGLHNSWGPQQAINLPPLSVEGNEL